MAIYHAASADRTNLVSDVYESAASQVNTICGVSYVNATLPAEEKSSTAAMNLLPTLTTTLGSILALTALMGLL